ncbi:MAG: MFS transporter [Acidimicrobiales bacterium]
MSEPASSGGPSTDGTKIPSVLVWFLVARAFDSTATSGLVTIVGFQVYAMTGDELDLGLLGLAEFLPSAVLVPFTGVLADRVDRRRVGAVGSALIGLLCLWLFAYIGTDPSDVWPIYLTMFAFGVIRAFQRPAVRALPADLAPPGTAERVVALSAASWQVGVIAGPFLAGVLYTLGVTLPYLFAAALMAVSVVSLLTVPSPQIERLRSRAGGVQMVRDAVEGLRYLRSSPIVGAAITLDLFAVLLGGAVALLPALAEQRLGLGARGLGALRASVGVGAASVTFLLAAVPIRRRVGTVLLAAVAVFGVATIALGLTTSPVVAFIAVFVLGASDSVSVFIRNTLVPLATPEAMRGRVLAVESVFIGASNELGAFESGVTAALFGLVPAVVFGGVGTLAVVAGFWFVVPTLRHIDRFSDALPASRAAPSPG